MGDHLEWNLELQFFVTFSDILRLIRDQSVVTGGEKPQQPPKINAQVTGNFRTCSGRNSKPSSGERQLAVSGNALDDSAIRTGPRLRNVSIGILCKGETRSAVGTPTYHMFELLYKDSHLDLAY